ncbi:MAG: SGNH/GDSL hydrolase family protein, partial [Chitinophagales bacterium]|nr:SGNH/GDSL hydrolase family protein [Chitinophagales bacterium]
MEFINYKDKLGLTFRGRYIGIDLKLQQLHTTDEIGINIYLKETEDIIKEYTINNQGFRSTYNFDSATVNAIKDTSFVIMFIGDSHTDGCCANPITNSFVNLVDKQLNYTALNFGIGGTDPLQYKLIAQKYLLKIKPDLLIVNLCLGNDFINFERKPNPNHPLHFQTNYNWLDARYPKTHPNYQPDTYFKNWEEAKNFYLKHYTTKIVDN